MREVFIVNVEHEILLRSILLTIASYTYLPAKTLASLVHGGRAVGSQVCCGESAPKIVRRYR